MAASPIHSLGAIDDLAKNFPTDRTDTESLLAKLKNLYSPELLSTVMVDCGQSLPEKTKEKLYRTLKHPRDPPWETNASIREAVVGTGLGVLRTIWAGQEGHSMLLKLVSMLQKPNLEHDLAAKKAYVTALCQYERHIKLDNDNVASRRRKVLKRKAPLQDKADVKDESKDDSNDDSKSELRRSKRHHGSRT